MALLNTTIGQFSMKIDDAVKAIAKLSKAYNRLKIPNSKKR